MLKKFFFDLTAYHDDIKSASKFNVKTLLHIGDWYGEHMPHEKYSGFVNNADKRKYFVKVLTGFILQYNFDGIAINWLAPSCPKVCFKIVF